MKKKGAKSGKKIGLDEFKRHTGALIEHVDDVFKLTNEELRGVHQTLDEHGKEVRGIKQVLDSHTQMIGQIMMDVEQIKFDLKQKVGYDEFAKLEKRVARMELRMGRA